MGENVIGSLQAKVNEHDGLIKEHTKDITEIKVHNAKYDTKLDTTNKILIAIATMLGGGLISFFFSVAKGLIK